MIDFLSKEAIGIHSALEITSDEINERLPLHTVEGVGGVERQGDNGIIFDHNPQRQRRGR
jgi:hypothetical protein